MVVFPARDAASDYKSPTVEMCCRCLSIRDLVKVLKFPTREAILETQFDTALRVIDFVSCFQCLEFLFVLFYSGSIIR